MYERRAIVDSRPLIFKEIFRGCVNHHFWNPSFEHIHKLLTGLTWSLQGSFPGGLHAGKKRVKINDALFEHSLTCLLYLKVLLAALMDWFNTFSNNSYFSTLLIPKYYWIKTEKMLTSHKILAFPRERTFFCEDQKLIWLWLSNPLFKV